MKFELPGLPLGWSWTELPPLQPNDSSEYTITVRAESYSPGRQYIEEKILVDIVNDKPDDILKLFQAVCDKICLRIIEVQSKPVQKNIDLLTDIYRVFAGTRQDVEGGE